MGVIAIGKAQTGKKIIEHSFFSLFFESPYF
jgi:hypothetical protein